MFINRSKSEEKILKFWKKNQIFEKSLEKKGEDFIFYEGPPTANAKPGVHHVLARAYKDVICRYKTMQGKRVLRKAGWDIHGLPVELEVEKKIGLKCKKEIEAHGIDKFNQGCKQSVWQCAQHWADLTERIGFWLDLENPYITGEPLYMETIFNIVKKISDKGLLYQDYKVVPYCPRCGTGLSSHEVAQGYKRIKEPAIYVKYQVRDFNSRINSEFKIQNSKFFLLVWTTTPWTLPGNVAVAINPNITYILAYANQGSGPDQVSTRKDLSRNEYLIIAKERREVLGENFEIVKEFKGEELVGLTYEPLFKREVVVPPQGAKNIYKILSADFVTTEEGTGLVHLAPAFGQEDMDLIKEQNIKGKTKIGKFPILLTVNEEGKFKPEVKKWEGMFIKKADPFIIKHLQGTNSLFKEEQYEHDYPFCWRCESPLLYYAKKSWFIRMSAVKERMIMNNQKINWLPKHIKEGRFGEWLNELKDWSLSRERYWGTPLPIWKCHGCEHQEVIGGRADLKKQKSTTNKYFILRHGEAISNIKGVNSSWPEKEKIEITAKGMEQVKEAVNKLKKEKIDIIFSSDILRTKQTAVFIGEELSLNINYDERLREIAMGELNGKSIEEARKYFNPEEIFSKREVAEKKFKEGFPGGENYIQVFSRMRDFIKDVDARYQNKNILIITHGDPIILLLFSFLGWTKEEFFENKDREYFDKGELREVNHNIFPYNEQGELDFHRPFVDEIEFICPKCGGLMKRVPEVIDCWFDSGSMPFAQEHWPFKNQSLTTNNHLAPPELFPADYISEAVDQTRGWFYTLLAISTLLGFESPYKNVIVLGHVLDEKGQKMSKSKGNTIDPWKMVERYGADSLRWYFYTINQPWDPKLFTEKDLAQRLKKFVMTFWNCYVFWKTYSPGALSEHKSLDVKNLLDRWIISKLNRLIENVTERLDKYDITGAGRAIEEFIIDDLSLWYVRRSRRRFQKPNSIKELEEASLVLGHLLLNLSRLTAPFTPFVSEEIYLGLTGKKFKLAVHLDDWPKSNKVSINNEVEEKMELVKAVKALGLRIRNDEKIKVRQPLASLKIQKLKFKIENELLNLTKEELNVKEVEVVEKIGKKNGWVIREDESLRISLNIEITAELQEEGVVREVGRQIQGMRKDAGCKPEDKIVVYYSGEKDLTELLVRNKKLILLQIRAKDFILQRKEKQRFNIERQLNIDGQEIWLALKIVVK